MSDKATVIDLFCGIGGFSKGFEMAGFEPILAIDFWKDAIDTYNFNHKIKYKSYNWFKAKKIQYYDRSKMHIKHQSVIFIKHKSNNKKYRK